MNGKRIGTSFGMTLRMLLRRRIVVVLLVVVPVVFMSIVEWTSSDMLLPFQLASLKNDVFIQVGQRRLSIVFFAIASAGFLIAFLALNLIQRNRRINRRLIICGYKPAELVMANFLTLALAIVVISVYVGLLSRAYIQIDRLQLFILGLICIGFVYGAYGLVVGSLINGELEGILFVVLLANIDAGWLQNPLFYAAADHQAFITYLPAFYPAQTSIIAAFTDYPVVRPLMGSIIHGLAFLALALVTFFYRMRLKR